MSNRLLEVGAAIATAALTISIAWMLMRYFSAIRYDGTIHINIYGLGLLTIATAVPGAAIALVAIVVCAVQRRMPRWVKSGLIGAASAAIGAICLAVAADCVPHCKGARGDVVSGALFALPAGFAVGALAFGAWFSMYRPMVMLLRREAKNDV